MDSYHQYIVGMAQDENERVQSRFRNMTKHNFCNLVCYKDQKYNQIILRNKRNKNINKKSKKESDKEFIKNSENNLNDENNMTDATDIDNENGMGFKIQIDTDMSGLGSHQINMATAMRVREILHAIRITRLDTNLKSNIISQFGILVDRYGTGIHEVVARVLKTPMEDRPIWDSIFPLVSYTLESSHSIKTSLISCYHYNIKAWERVLKANGLTYLKIDSKDFCRIGNRNGSENENENGNVFSSITCLEEMKRLFMTVNVVLVSSKAHNKFVKWIDENDTDDNDPVGIRFNRVILDELERVNIREMSVLANFYWFVTPNPESLIIGDYPNSIISKIFQVMDISIFESALIENNDTFVRKCLGSPEPKMTVVECFDRDQNGVISIPRNYAKKSNIRRYKAQIIKSLNIESYNTEKLKSNGYNMAIKKYQECKTCPVCMDKFYSYPLLYTCCQTYFCLECFIKSARKKTTCPLCRTELKWKTIKVLDEQGNIEKSKAIDLPKDKSISLEKILKKIFPNENDWKEKKDVNANVNANVKNKKNGNSGNNNEKNVKIEAPSVMMISDNPNLIKVAQPLIDNKRLILIKDPNKLYLRERRDIDKLIITEMERMSWSDETSIMQKFDVRGRKKKLVTYWLYYPTEDEE